MPAESKSSKLLEARGVSRSFSVGKTRIEVLKSVDLALEKGELVFLCGASGAGKTTLLHTLAGLERPEKGEIVFEGRSIYRIGGDQLSALRNARMGFVFQSYFLLPELTALENVLLPAMIAKNTRPEAAIDLLNRVGLGKRIHHLPSELSGGEQQRVAIARALINNPGILYADEPTGNLDSKTGASIMELLMSLVKETQCTLLVVTHDTSLARLGDRILRVCDGSVVENSHP